MSRPDAPADRAGVLAGSLLMAATGAVDAYTFLQHGHVFAQAMTGNLVLVAVGAVAPGIVTFWQPLATFGGFLLGVVAAWLWTRRDPGRAPQLGTLVLQAAVLVAVGFLPAGFPQVVITVVIAFTSGLQISTFRRVGTAPFTTTVMTSNSMRLVDWTLTALTSGLGADRTRAWHGVAAFAGFVVGIFTGAVAARFLGDGAAWVVAGLYLLTAALHARRPAS